MKKEHQQNENEQLCVVAVSGSAFEAIENKWVELIGRSKYKEIRFRIGESGFAYFCNEVDEFKGLPMDRRINKSTVGYRPHSLRNIENNNHWIKIENIEDLPEETDTFFFAWKKGELIGIYLKEPLNRDRCFMQFVEDEITHLRPIDNPLPPIF